MLHGFVFFFPTQHNLAIAHTLLQVTISHRLVVSWLGIFTRLTAAILWSCAYITSDRCMLPLDVWYSTKISTTVSHIRWLPLRRHASNPYPSNASSTNEHPSATISSAHLLAKVVPPGPGNSFSFISSRAPTTEKKNNKSHPTVYRGVQQKSPELLT